MLPGLRMEASSAQNAKSTLRAALSFLRGVRSVLRSSPRIARTFFLRALDRSDYKRWNDAGNLQAWWEARTQAIAALVPKGARVIEFGAGRRWLESHLDASCAYTPSDLVDRGPGTIICDLNTRPLPDLSSLHVDTAVFVGVLEYVKDLPAVSSWLSRLVRTCVVSYECAYTRDGSVWRTLESLSRAHFGYMNAYREDELIAIFAGHGFTCVRTDTWNKQRLFLFQAISGDLPH